MMTLRREGIADAEIYSVQIKLSSTDDGNMPVGLRRFLLLGVDVPTRFRPLRPNIDVLVIDGVEWTITNAHARPFNVAYEVEIQGVS